jgi:class 3 adenylate cyclase
MTGPFHSQLDIKNKRKSAHIGPYQLKGIDDPIEVFRLQNPKAFDDSKPTD